MFLLLLWACTSLPDPVPPSSTWTDPGLDATGASAAVALHLEAPSRVELPDSTLPPGTSFGEPRPLHVEVQEAVRPNVRRFRAPMPFDIAVVEDFNPEEVVVLVDGERVAHRRGMPHWEADRYNFYLVMGAGEGHPDVEVSWPGLERRLTRRDPRLSGLPDPEYLHIELTLDDTTRDGILLPAPGLVEWAVTVPPGAVFDTWVAMDRARVPGVHSDGAEVQLYVVEGDEATLVERFPIRRPSFAFQPWQVDLSAWAGRNITLRLVTAERGDHWADYVFLGAPTVFGRAEGEVRRVVVIGMDTTRPDHFGFMGYPRNTTPALDRIAGQSVIFERAWTPAPRTRPSFRSATTGRNPIDAVGAKTIGAVFRDHDFATAAYVSNVHLRPRFGFHEGFDVWSYDGDADAAQQVDRAIDWLDRYRDRDGYLFLHVMDPHTAYIPPASYRRRFVTEERPALPDRMHRWHVMDLEREGKLDDADRRFLRELYDAELAYTSDQLGRLFDHLDRLGGRTLVVIHSDHGEEFWEHGGFEHNHTLYDEVTRALLVFRSRTGQAQGVRSQVPATLADIAATLYDLAGFEDLPPLDGQSLRPWLEDPDADPGWTRPLGIAHLRYGFERWGVVYDDHKYVVFTGSGEEELYDLSKDPGEQNNLLASRPRMKGRLFKWQQRLEDAHPGMTAGPGWRIHVSAARGAEPVVMELPAEPVGASILDPERTIPNPANQAWGDPPRRTIEEIGEIRVDGKTLTWTPGPNPHKGIIAVVFHEPQPPQALEVVERGAATLRAIPGTVLLPPDHEAQRMAELGHIEGSGGTDQHMLESLGYVDPDDG